MHESKDSRFIEYYGLQDVPKRVWFAPKTYQAMVEHHERKQVIDEVKTFVVDKVWRNLFLIGSLLGCMTIAGLIWKAAL